MNIPDIWLRLYSVYWSKVQTDVWHNSHLNLWLVNPRAGASSFMTEWRRRHPEWKGWWHLEFMYDGVVKVLAAPTPEELHAAYVAYTLTQEGGDW